MLQSLKWGQKEVRTLFSVQAPDELTGVTSCERKPVSGRMPENGAKCDFLRFGQSTMRYLHEIDGSDVFCSLVTIIASCCQDVWLAL